MVQRKAKKTEKPDETTQEASPPSGWGAPTVTPDVEAPTEPTTPGDTAPDAKVEEAPQQKAAPPTGDNSAGFKELIGFVERVERLKEEQKALAEDVKEVFAEVKYRGFDVKTLRKVLQRRTMDPAKRREMDDLIDTYEHALGMAD